MNPKEKYIRELFVTAGYVFPTTPTEIEQFKSSNDTESISPPDWNDPLKILERGTQKFTGNISTNITDADIQNLAMAARQGKSIPNDVRQKMIEDKKNAKK